MLLKWHLSICYVTLKQESKISTRRPQLIHLERRLNPFLDILPLAWPSLIMGKRTDGRVTAFDTPSSLI
jgi:hypothetical protein